MIGTVSIEVYPPDRLDLRVTCCQGHHEAAVELTATEARTLADQLDHYAGHLDPKTTRAAE